MEKKIQELVTFISNHGKVNKELKPVDFEK